MEVDALEPSGFVRDGIVGVDFNLDLAYLQKYFDLLFAVFHWFFSELLLRFLVIFTSDVILPVAVALTCNVSFPQPSFLVFQSHRLASHIDIFLSHLFCLKGRIFIQQVTQNVEKSVIVVVKARHRKIFPLPLI